MTSSSGTLHDGSHIFIGEGAFNKNGGDAAEHNFIYQAIDVCNTGLRFGAEAKNTQDLQIVRSGIVLEGIVCGDECALGGGDRLGRLLKCERKGGKRLLESERVLGKIE